MSQPLTHHRLARRGRWHFRRSHAALLLGVAVATAVLTGALVVGDSVRGSLRDLTLQRLGNISHAMMPGRLFREAYAEEIKSSAGFDRHFSAAEPILTMPASLSAQVKGRTRRTSRVTLHGILPRFWEADAVPRPAMPEGLLLSQSLAEELSVAAGDEIVVRVGIVSTLPADSPLGEKRETTVSLRTPVTAVLPTEGLARFSLTPSQQAPRNVFLPLNTVQKLIEATGKCNAILFVGLPSNEDDVATEWLASPGFPSPGAGDYGVSCEKIHAGIWQIESKQLVLPEGFYKAAQAAFGKESVQPVTTYLANTINRVNKTRIGNGSIPYSIVTGVEKVPGREQVIADDEIILNRWAADDLKSELRDRMTITYYEPESTHGVLKEAPPIALRLAAIVELKKSDGTPTAAADPRLTPRLAGVTDAASINDWDLPFDLVETIRPQDETYWEERTTTPKAFVSLSLAERLWGSRWGKTSLLRIESDLSAEEIEAKLIAQLNPADFGFAPIPIKKQGLAAASGSTPFDVLFLLFSLFLIASALMLISLLVRLAIDARSQEVGLFGAIGWSRRRIRWQFLLELSKVISFGVLLGVLSGIAYAQLLLWLLRTVWIDAITTPFLQFHASWMSLLGSAVIGLIVSWLTVWHAIRKATQTPPRQLLAGASADTTSLTNRKNSSWSMVVCLSIALAAVASGCFLRGEAAAGAFFAAGGATLAAGLFAIRSAFTTGDDHAKPFTLPRLALRNARRNLGRSLLTLGLVAAASFLILATSAFRLPPTEEGTGGFSLIAQSDLPLHYDLNTSDGRFELGFSQSEEQLLADATIYGFRSQPGEDASCRNLYQTHQPRSFGVTDRFIASFDKAEEPGFAWAECSKGYKDNPWRALTSPPKAKAIPVILDFNTAVYALKLYGGVGSQLEIEDEAGQPLTLEVVGLLKNSLLQGELLMSEANLLRAFPSVSGQSFFLIGGTKKTTEVAETLEGALSDYSLEVERTDRRLADFLAVQNTYLSTFQALGALGLLLGAIGLAVAQLRNLMERRGELALMRAAGFTKSRLRRMVLWENALLLAGGLALGALAAAVALTPLSVSSGAHLPWMAALLLTGATAIIGLVASRLATNKALAAPITPALRGD